MVKNVVFKQRVVSESWVLKVKKGTASIYEEGEMKTNIWLGSHPEKCGILRMFVENVTQPT